MHRSPPQQPSSTMQIGKVRIICTRPCLLSSLAWMKKNLRTGWTHRHASGLAFTGMRFDSRKRNRWVQILKGRTAEGTKSLASEETSEGGGLITHFGRLEVNAFDAGFGLVMLAPPAKRFGPMVWTVTRTPGDGRCTSKGTSVWRAGRPRTGPH